MEPLSSLLTSLRTVDPSTLDQEYSMVRSLTSTSKRELGLTTEAGAQKENIKKNRYKDILPYDQSRVVLSLVTEDSDSDYINASFIKGAAADRQYIACQAPLSSTLIDFWRMIWQYGIKVIVMACREIEMGKRKSECYWSPVHQSSTFGPFTVSTEEKRPGEDLIIRSLTVSFQQETRSLIQYQFLAWPDHDVPDEASSVVQLLDSVRASHRTHTSPLLVHCSAGCGRTGVICALDYIHDLLVTGRVSADFSIRNLVLELRRQRPSAVQTKEQYQFIFTAAAAMLEQMLQSSKQELYSNLPQPKKKPEKKINRTPVSSTKRHSQPVAMSDTYAVVNKSKHPQPPASSPAFAASVTPRSSHASRTPSSSHHYDNEGPAAAPIYSTVKPRARPASQQPSAPPLYDTAAPANDRPEPDDDYENVSPPVTDTPSPCSPGGIGFNCRIQRPRGPREPPAEWSRLER